MSFSQDFEEDVNRSMQEDTEQQEQSEEKNIKKYLDAKGEREEDQELSEKKDRPPRFSALFGGTPPPQIVERYIEQPRHKKRGVWIPLPLFIILAIILFFETTLLFAYTIIALDNNLTSGLFPVSKTRVDDCPQQQAINVAPKFYMGPGQSGPALPDKAPTTTTSTTKPTAAGTAHTTQVVVVTPTAGPPPSSTLMLTVDPSGSTISPSPTSTSTSTVNAKKRASIRSKFESIVSDNTLGQKEAPTPTTLLTAKTSTSTEEADATTSAAGGGGVCFGGAGAVGLVCPDGVGINTKV